MKLRTLIFRSLLHYRGLNAALVLGIALATAILSGSLLVGDSVRGSLRELALIRLGHYSHAMLTTSPFEESLAARLNADPEFKKDFILASPFLQLRGRAVSEDGQRAVGGVQIMAMGLVEDGLRPGYANAGEDVADPLNLQKGTSFLLSIPTLTDMPQIATLARRSRADVLSSLRVALDATIRTPSFERDFTAAPSQRAPRNVWVAMRDLQQAVNQPGRANMLLVWGSPEKSPNAFLKKYLSLPDYGLAVAPVANSAQLQLTSRSTYLRPPVLDALKKSVAGAQLFSTNLLTRVELTPKTAPAEKPAALHYVISSATDSPLIDGKPLGENQVAINQWTADQFHAVVGDRLTFSFLRRVENGNLVETPSQKLFTIARILPADHPLSTDSSLTPNYHGLTDADSVADWSPPEGFPFDRKLVTAADEAYWKAHRAAPKVFLPLSAATLWASPIGTITSARLDGDAAKVQTQLLAALQPADFGLSFQPIRQQQLAAAAGSTDFAMYFISFSFFLILAALILLSLLFRLSVEQRTRQLGLLAALGFAPKRIRKVVLAEGLLLALIGTALGTVGGLAYTALMIKLLTTLWLPAVGTTQLHLYAAPESLITGALISLVLSAFTLLLSVRKLVKLQPLALLAGRTEAPIANRSSTPARRSPLLVIGRWSLIVGAVLALLAMVIATSLQLLKPDIACMLAGLTLLLAALLYARRFLRTPVAKDHGSLDLPILAARNARLRPTRSLLVIALIACASFILILVGSMKESAPEDPAIIPSGTGGFRLILTADIPLLGDLGTPEGRKLLALKDPNNPLLNRARFTNLRAWQGQDISCLNMTKPTQPTILGVGPALLSRFVATSGDGRPFVLPDSVSTDGVAAVPAVADANTAQYILHLDLNQSFPLKDQTGADRQLDLVGVLTDSIFQSELLIPSSQFSTLFPLQTGTAVVLIECPAEDAQPLARLLESELDDFSVIVEPTTARLARYKEVANTYLATFQTLGAFGLLLGTIGLAIVLLRSALERRSELALLLALGFTPGRVARLVLLENTYLLAAGLAIGTVTALLAVAPAARTLNIPTLALSFVAIFAAGFLSLLAALRLASRHLSPASLRND